MFTHSETNGSESATIATPTYNTSPDHHEIKLARDAIARELARTLPISRETLEAIALAKRAVTQAQNELATKVRDSARAGIDRLSR